MTAMIGPSAVSTAAMAAPVLQGPDKANHSRYSAYTDETKLTMEATAETAIRQYRRSRFLEVRELGNKWMTGATALKMAVATVSASRPKLTN
ncbi:MAG: hypothetical protein R2867_42105 [Caldilineaceae bacterium]